MTETVVVLRVAVVQDIDVVNSSETVKLQFYWGNINFQRAHVISRYFENTFYCLTVLIRKEQINAHFSSWHVQFKVTYCV